MPPAATPGSKAASLALKKALLETLAIKEHANQLLLRSTADTRFGGTAGSAASQ